MIPKYGYTKKPALEDLTDVKVSQSPPVMTVMAVSMEVLFEFVEALMMPSSTAVTWYNPGVPISPQGSVSS
jgi:hypothetical protein